jgi:hypothetical protein
MLDDKDFEMEDEVWKLLNVYRGLNKAALAMALLWRGES